jgi:hypothetical protein
LKELGLAHRALADLPKNAPAKALLAHIITEQTSVPQKWIAQTLHMGSAPYVSKLAKEMKQAIPRSKKWRDVKQSMIRFMTSPHFYYASFVVIPSLPPPLRSKGGFKALPPKANS